MATESARDQLNTIGYAMKSAERAGVGVPTGDDGDPWGATLRDWEQACKKAGSIPVLVVMDEWAAKRVFRGEDELYSFVKATK